MVVKDGEQLCLTSFRQHQLEYIFVGDQHLRPRQPHPCAFDCNGRLIEACFQRAGVCYQPRDEQVCVS